MNTTDERIKLLERLFAEVRFTCKKGSPATVMFAGAVLAELEKIKSGLDAQIASELQPVERKEQVAA